VVCIWFHVFCVLCMCFMCISCFFVVLFTCHIVVALLMPKFRGSSGEVPGSSEEDPRKFRGSSEVVPMAV
jgi:hypothetical protein